MMGSCNPTQRIAIALAALAATALALPALAVTEIHVLSNRADLISGGDALVEVTPVPPAGTVIDVDGNDVTGAFGLDGDGRYVGVVTGLAVGANTLTVTHLDSSGASIVIENHPTEGPVFSGPHLQPWDCSTEGNGLGAPDANCNAPPIVDYQYVSTGGGGYQSYDLENPPGDVANVTNTEGVTVRNIVRSERGSINRALYAFAYLHDPEDGEPSPQNPPAGWNGKLYYPFGASCNTNQTQGPMPGVINQTRLQQGWAVATTSLNTLGHHCNPVISAESAMMTKERLVEQVGQIRYTMSTGGSGGAIGQLQVSNAYPGITNGLMPGAMFPDVWSTAIEVADCAIFEVYYPTSTLTPLQRAAVDGHGPPQSSCAAWVGTFVPSGIPTTGCFSNATIPTASTPEARDYNPVTNPDGCRATVNDLQFNVWGPRKQDGFAKRPIDNEGVQYGLDALNLPIADPGKISFAQFLHLNANIGGTGIDGIPTVERTRTDPGVPEMVYRTSMINDGRGLAHAAIINFANGSNIEIHTSYHAYALEARMAEIGHEDNHAIWHSGPGGTAWDVMDAWLAAVEADGGIDPLTGMDPTKVKAHRPLAFAGAPLGATDSCWSGGQQPLAACADQVFGDLRTEAGMPIRHDNLKCQLKDIDPADYAGAVPPLTPVDLLALEAIFPAGVCDYSVPAADKAPSVQWLTYENGPGGEPLGPVPTSTAF